MSEQTQPSPAVLKAAAMITGTDISAAGRPLQQWVRATCILGIGDILAGAADALPRALLALPGGTSGAGPSLIFATGIRTRALEAAFVNAAAAGAAQGRPGALLAGLVALAEERQANGAALMAAVLASKRAEALSGGFVLSVAAGASCLLGLDAQQAAHALGLAYAGRSDAGEGALAAAGAIRTGMLAALLAEQGIMGPTAGLADMLDLALEPTALDARLLDAQPVPDEGTLWDCFEMAAKRSLSRDRIAPVFERLETLDKISDMTTLTRLLQSSEVGRPEPKTVTFAARGAHEPEETTWVP